MEELGSNAQENRHFERLLHGGSVKYIMGKITDTTLEKSAPQGLTLPTSPGLVDLGDRKLAPKSVAVEEIEPEAV